MIDLDELDRLAQAATPGPWHVAEGEEWPRVREAEGFLIAGCANTCMSDDGAGNAAFIAACDPATVRALVAVARAQGEMLRRLEWSGYESGDVRHWHCPICGNWQDDGHASDCELAALLAALPGAAGTGGENEQ